MPTTVFQLSRVDSLQSGDVLPAYISADGDTRGIEYGKLSTQIQTTLSSTVNAALLEAQSLVTQAEEALDAVTDISNEVSSALAAEDGAIAARLQAEAARDSAFVNANVYADTATGLAAVTDGQQFQVVLADGLSIQRYQRNAGPVAVAVGSPYPTSEAVERIRRAQNGAVSESINLFDKDDPDFQVDRRVNHVSGGLDVSVGYDASGYIRVKPSTVYRLTNRNRIAWYNSAKVFISGNDANADPTVTSPVGAAYLRCSLFRTGLAIFKEFFMVTETAATPTVYVPFGGMVDPARIRNITDTSFLDGAITPRKLSFINSTKNLFNVATITPDTSIAASGVTSVNAAYDLSDFIPVTAGLPYVGNGNIRFYAAYDASKTIMQAAGSNSQVNAGVTLTPAANVAFVRITTYAGETAAFQFEQNTAITGYVPWGFSLSSAVQVPPATVTSPWLNTITASYGDSITAGLAWQPYIVTALGLAHTAYGVGGRQVGGATGMCQDAAVNTIPTNVELVLVLGGANDWAQSRALGLPTSTNTEEFYGALNQMCLKLQTRLPNAQIVLMATIYNERPLTIGTTNLVGLTTRDYAEACRVAGKRWGLPVVDTDQIGINTINVDAFMGDDGSHVHPNALGGARIASAVIGKLKSLEPL